MKHKFLDSSINFLQKYNSYSSNDIKKLRYGLEGLYLTITKLAVIFILSIFLSIIKEVVIVLVLFNIIRYFAFGFHAEKSSECLFLSIINFVLIPFVLLKLKIALSTALIIAGICIVNFILFAPADTVKRPLFDKRKRLIRKVLTIITGLIYILIMILFNNFYFNTLIVSSLIIQVIVISPITYKIFGQPYNNYKKSS